MNIEIIAEFMAWLSFPLASNGGDLRKTHFNIMFVSSYSHKHKSQALFLRMPVWKTFKWFPDVPQLVLFLKIR